MRETVSDNKWYVCRCPGSSHKYRRIFLGGRSARLAAGDRKVSQPVHRASRVRIYPEFLLSARKFATSPSASFACSVSLHPFPRTLDRPPGSLPFILNLAALVFRLFGMYSGGLRDRAAWHSVHHRRHRHHHPRSGPPPAGCANRILHGVPAHLGLSFSTWDEQVEQDRVPPFFLHLIELARASHCEITKPSSISLPRRRPRKGCK